MNQITVCTVNKPSMELAASTLKSISKGTDLFVLYVAGVKLSDTSICFVELPDFQPLQTSKQRLLPGLRIVIVKSSNYSFLDSLQEIAINGQVMHSWNN